MQQLTPDLCIIGAGSAGLSIAAGAVQMGAEVVLIERDKMGGDCLNTGCVPSKSLLAAGKTAQTIRDAQFLGIQTQEPEIDFQKVHDHVHKVIAAIEPNDSIERFEKLGVQVIQAKGCFKNPDTVIAANYEIRARRFIIATGSSADVPPIPGIEQTPYLTNETIFDLTTPPEHLIIIGGGPIGCEMAQAHRLLGCRVSILELNSILPKDEPELVELARQQLNEQGIHLYEGIKVKQVESTGKGIEVTIKEKGKEQKIQGSHLLIATGRKPNLEALELNQGNIKTNRQGVETNQRLRSVSNKKVFAAGDAAGSYQFTHIASYHAGIIIKNCLFGLPAKTDYRTLPWVTYIAPELAHVGMLESEVKEKKIDYQVLYWDFADNDRAQAEHATFGKMKVLVNKKGFILGCSIFGKQAGELLLPWTLAIQEKLKIGALANAIVPYPTFSEVSKRIAGSYYTKTLFSKKTKWVVRLIQKLLP